MGKIVVVPEKESRNQRRKRERERVGLSSLPVVVHFP